MMKRLCLFKVQIQEEGIFKIFQEMAGRGWKEGD
jgi:hypothetical protein